MPLKHLVNTGTPVINRLQICSTKFRLALCRGSTVECISSWLGPSVFTLFLLWFTSVERNMKNQSFVLAENSWNSWQKYIIHLFYILTETLSPFRKFSNNCIENQLYRWNSKSAKQIIIVSNLNKTKLKIQYGWYPNFYCKIVKLSWTNL